VFAFPCSHWRRLRTFNVGERPNKEIKRRTRVAGLSPHETSLLRLVFAVLIEISEEWGAEKTYLCMENDSNAEAA
jgi:putative transposase